jgi:hypothetical protein
MVLYDKWKHTDFLVTSLELDPRNARIPHSHARMSQRDIAADLVEHDKVFDLARSIADNGYYPIEAIILVAEDGHRYVIEGNRRVAALKLLLSPEFAPEDWQPRFRALANRVDPKAIKRVKAVSAPSREAAAPIIMSRHTQSQIESWSPLMQARFYRNLVTSKIPIQDIASQYHIPLASITNALRMDMMYSIACVLDLPDDVAAKVRNPREFPITTLERIYENPKGLESLGIKFDEAKGLVGSVKREEFQKGYSRIVSDIATRKVDSRALNTSEHIRGYLQGLGTDRPDLSRRGQFTLKSLLGTARPIGVPQDGAGKRPSRRSKPKPLALIPASFICEVNNQRITDFFRELTTLKVAQFPNAVSLMLRSLVELSLSYYLSQTGHMQSLVDKRRGDAKAKDQALPRDWHPTLKQMLAYVVAEADGIVRNPNVLKALRKLLSDKDALLSVDSLDLYVHNPYVPPDEAALRRFWGELEGLLQITLVEPDGQPSA